jgi:hypothetical protein
MMQKEIIPAEQLLPNKLFIWLQEGNRTSNRIITNVIEDKCFIIKKLNK